MEKQNSRTFPGLFFIFQRLNSFPILYKTTRKMHFFQPETSKWKGALIFFDSDSSDKNRDYRTNWIEKNASRTSLFNVYLAIFTQFFFFAIFTPYTINLKGLIFKIFQGLIHIFKEDLTKFDKFSRTKDTFFKFQEFSRTTVKFKDFSRSGRTLNPLVIHVTCSPVTIHISSIQTYIGLVARKPGFAACEQQRYREQPAHPHSLISNFVFAHCNV